MIPAHPKFVLDVDGYQYYWPDGRGHYNSAQLRAIADELDTRNAPWDAIVRAEVGSSPQKGVDDANS